MKTLKFYNDKGNALNGVRKQIKDMVESNLTLGNFELNHNGVGELYAHIANDEENGTPIYAVITVAISDRDVPARQKTVKEAVETISIPALFD